MLKFCGADKCQLFISTQAVAQMGDATNISIGIVAGAHATSERFCAPNKNKQKHSCAHTQSNDEK